MTVDRIIEMAKMLGWRVYVDQVRFKVFPFCGSNVIREIILTPPISDSGRPRYLYEQVPNQTYKARHLFEINKVNSKMIAKIRKTPGYEDVLAALDYCT
jgi:hypothetical protein